MGANGAERHVRDIRHIEQRLREMASRIAADAGLELVDLVLRGAGRQRVLRVDIDRSGVEGVNLEDCQRVSRALGEALDAEAELLPSAYVLEVSSPGADRPIRSPDDFRRNVGRRVVVTVTDPVLGSRLHHGRLLGCEAGQVHLMDDDERELRFPLDAVVSARQDLEFRSATGRSGPGSRRGAA
jgi:ribosome maturation factor RimP